MPDQVYFNDSCCCDHEPNDPADVHSVGDLEGPADVIQPDWIPVCAGAGPFLDAADPVPSEMWTL